MCLITDNSKEVQGQVPIYQKVTLTIKEAAEYSNIGINRIESTKMSVCVICRKKETGETEGV